MSDVSSAPSATASDRWAPDVDANDKSDGSAAGFNNGKIDQKEDDASSAAAGSSRKPKRSRWGTTDDVVPAAAAAAPEQPKKRRSRWGSETDKVELTAEMAAATAAMTPDQRELYLLRLRMQDITMKLANIQTCIPTDPALRSPSPPPDYDVNGKRTNTREQRIRERLIKERNELIERCIKLNPQFATPGDFKRQKHVAKLMIPQDEPGPYIEGQPTQRPHSYCGMILGPRGLTQKRMQKETNCKIEIRGRGSQKEGRRHKPHPSDNEDLHVLITAENENDLQRCVKMIEQLLQPVNEDNNEHKARQLRELAAINGTLRDEIRCRLCGERGHFVDKCPERTGAAWNPANVRCEVCGERGHPTSDCPTGGTVNTAERSRLKNEYENFMSELSGKASSSIDQDAVPKSWPPPPPPSSADTSYGAPPPPSAGASYGAPPPVHAAQPWASQNAGFYPPPPAPYNYGTRAPYYGGYDQYPPPPAAHPQHPPPPPHMYQPPQ